MSEYDNTTEEIRERADIVDHIGRVVKLRKRGVLWEGLCPFHNEKTPSFKVYEDSQHYHCYGCGASGDVFSFYMKYYNLNFVEAKTRLAEEYGIDWQPGGKYESESRKREYYEINREAALYYHQALKQPDNAGYLYLAERGLTKETMTAFGLGYADGSGDGLCRHLREKGMSLEKAAEMKLIMKDDKRGADRYYDRYYDRRAMFPIMNVTGKVIGFSARTIEADEKKRKYINSSESRIFLKKDNLYALNRTKDAISAARTAIIVEGQMDVVSVWQHGVANVAASLGTALTDRQARLLARFADRVVLAYDMDDAGQAAAVKGGEALRAVGLDVKVLSLPSGKDPDEYIRAHGRDDFLARVDEAAPYLEFLLRRLLSEFDLGQKEGTVAFLKTAAGVLRKMSPVERAYYVGWLAELTGISAEAIDAEAGAGSGAGRGSGAGSGGQGARGAYGGSGGSGGSGGPDARENPRPRAARPHAPPHNNEKLQRVLIRLLLHDPAFLADLRGRERDFTSPVLERVYRAVVAATEDSPDGVVDTGALESSLEGEDAAALREILEGEVVEDNPARQLENCLAHVDAEHLVARKTRVDKAVAALIGNGGKQEEILQLSEELKEINKELAEVRERIRG